MMSDNDIVVIDDLETPVETPMDGLPPSQKATSKEDIPRGTERTKTRNPHDREKVDRRMSGYITGIGLRESIIRKVSKDKISQSEEQTEVKTASADSSFSSSSSASSRSVKTTTTTLLSSPVVAMLSPSNLSSESFAVEEEESLVVTSYASLAATTESPALLASRQSIELQKKPNAINAESTETGKSSTRPRKESSEQKLAAKKMLQGSTPVTEGAKRSNIQSIVISSGDQVISLSIDGSNITLSSPKRSTQITSTVEGRQDLSHEVSHMTQQRNVVKHTATKGKDIVDSSLAEIRELPDTEYTDSERESGEAQRARTKSRQQSRKLANGKNHNIQSVMFKNKEPDEDELPSSKRRNRKQQQSFDEKIKKVANGGTLGTTGSTLRYRTISHECSSQECCSSAILSPSDYVHIGSPADVSTSDSKMIGKKTGMKSSKKCNDSPKQSHGTTRKPLVKDGHSASRKQLFKSQDHRRLPEYSQPSSRDNKDIVLTIGHDEDQQRLLREHLATTDDMNAAVKKTQQLRRILAHVVAISALAILILILYLLKRLFVGPKKPY